MCNAAGGCFAFCETLPHLFNPANRNCSLCQPLPAQLPQRGRLPRHCPVPLRFLTRNLSRGLLIAHCVHAGARACVCVGLCISVWANACSRQDRRSKQAHGEAGAGRGGAGLAGLMRKAGSWSRKWKQLWCSAQRLQERRRPS